MEIVAIQFKKSMEMNESRIHLNESDPKNIKVKQYILKLNVFNLEHLQKKKKIQEEYIRVKTKYDEITYIGSQR